MTRELGNVKGSENQIGVRIEHEISHTPSEALGLCLLCVFACGNDEAMPGEGTISCPGLNACFLSGDRYGKFPCRSSISRSYGYLLHAERAFTSGTHTKVYFEGVRFFLVEPKSCFHAGDFVARRGAIASICRRPASLDLGLAFRWPISRARRSRPQGPAQIESVALCVWQCHLRNVSTLSNRTHFEVLVLKTPPLLRGLWYNLFVSSERFVLFQLHPADEGMDRFGAASAVTG